MVDKLIHKDQFKLRLLLTNGCNRHCSFCLNDFQELSFIDKVDGKFDYLSMEVFDVVVETYLKICSHRKITPEIYLSGGEPTIHPKFFQMLNKLLTHENLKVVLNTNGEWPKFYSPGPNNKASNFERELFVLKEQYPNFHIHFGVHNSSTSLKEKVLKFKGSIQAVASKNIRNEIFDLVEFYSLNNIKMKLFQNFFENSEQDRINYLIFLKKLTHSFPDEVIEGRHTGVQINRGIGCVSCRLSCCTLKALWVRPDGTMSPCPQAGHRNPLEQWRIIPFEEGNNTLLLLIDRAFRFHQYRPKVSKMLESGVLPKP